ncbi:hypothetical protein [Streptomyces sp. TP-A0874]|uniref:hypothetical protein n=1 Tax=Streptomyces sp. TP-A0874 TaxID=549819 RepID=UPI000853CB79|nr:hypothetical protein [Streptomyces sp. TP-A0874]
MRNKASRLRVFLAVPALLLAAACGGGSDSGEEPGAEADRARNGLKESGPVLSTAQLEKAIIAEGELKGFTVEPPGAAEEDETEGEEGDADEPSEAEWRPAPKAKADRAECASILVAGVERPIKDTRNVTRRTLRPVAGAKPGQSVSVALLATRGGSVELLRDLKAAVPKCADGFEVSAEGETSRYSEISPADAHTTGDETMAYTATVDGKDSEWALKVVVARAGSTVAVFVGSGADGKPADLPQSLLDKQLAKLAKA